jgi:pimeloyl-ACP methyl ester carboxylesterase
MNIVVDDYVVNYEYRGKGKIVLLLHGWGDTLSTFHSISSILSTSYTLISVDLIGFGGSDAPKGALNLHDYAEFVKKFIRKLTGSDELYAIVGHSNGGAIAIKIVSEDMLRCDKLVLLASSGIRSTYKPRKKALRLAAKTAKIPIMLLPKNIQKKLKKKAYSLMGSDLFVAEHLQDTFKKVVSEDLLEQAKHIAIPTLLLYGSEDTATPPAYGEMYRQNIRGSQLEIIEAAGHFLHHTHDTEVARKIGLFLQ